MQINYLYHYRYVNVFLKYAVDYATFNVSIFLMINYTILFRKSFESIALIHTWFTCGHNLCSHIYLTLSVYSYITQVRS